MTANPDSTFADPFGNDNARYLNPTEVASTFVPLNTFWNLFSDKNHILMGTRGSGKTVLAKMMSHDHLCLLEHPKAELIILEKRYIGTYTPSRLIWVTGVDSLSPLQPETGRNYFIIRFNSILAQSFVNTLRSCLHNYVKESDQPDTEYELVREICRLWAPSAKGLQIYTLRELIRKISDADFAIQRASINSSYSSDHINLSDFENDILRTMSLGPAEPVFALKPIADKIFALSDKTQFIIAIDEMEFLSEQHHLILNGLMRSATPGFIFKFITAPYRHHTLQTETNEPLIDGNDFSYVQIDHDRLVDSTNLNISVRPKYSKILFAIALFTQRARAGGFTVDGDTLGDLLGASDVLEPMPVNTQSIAEFSKLVVRFGNQQTVARMNRLRDEYRKTSESNIKTIRTKISDEIIRKMKPMISIRQKMSVIRGASKSDIYSGLEMIIACSDQNPRILLRCFNNLFPDLKRPEPKLRAVEKKRQNEVMETISLRFFESALAVKEVGPMLSALLNSLGETFRSRLHDGQLSTDYYGTVVLDKNDTEMNNLIHSAVAWGFMYPHFKDEKRDNLPAEGGEFRLAYTLAPMFHILPRRGRSIPMSSVIPQLSLKLPQ